MKNRSRKKEKKRRKEGEIIERGDSENWVKSERRRRNCSGGIVG